MQKHAKYYTKCVIYFSLLLCIAPNAAQAGPFDLTICVLTIASSGTLAMAPTGTELSTAQGSGSPATLSVVATGINPTISFSGPSVSGPSSSGSTAQLAFSSNGGAARSFANTGYVYPMTRLIDQISIHGRAINPNGFRAGAYTVTATATCGQ